MSQFVNRTYATFRKLSHRILGRNVGALYLAVALFTVSSVAVNTISDGLSALAALRKQTADLTDDSLQARLNRAVCDVYASNASSSLAAGLGGNAVAGEVCGKYWRDIGADPPAEVAPFEGGQCEGDSYVISRTFTGEGGQASQGGETVELTGLIGPVSSISPSSLTVVGDAPLKSQTFTVTAANGTFSFTRVFGIVGGGQQVYRYFPRRADSAPDTCGNPPGDLQPSPDYPSPRPIGVPTDIGIPGGDIEPWVFDTPGGIITGSPVGDSALGEGSPEVAFNPLGGTPPVGEGGVLGGNPSGVEGGNETDTGGDDEGSDGGELDASDRPPGADPSKDYFCIGYRWELVGFPSREGKISGTETVFPRVVGNLQLKLKGDGNTFFRGDVLRLYADKGTITVPHEKMVCKGIFWSRSIKGRLLLRPLYISSEQQISEV